MAMTDDFRDVQKTVEPPSHVDAKRLLRSAKIEPQEICTVLSDSIIYRGPAGQVRTAWLKASEDGKVRLLCTDEGMPAWPSRPGEDETEEG